jgi:hypothetical protein
MNNQGITERIAKKISVSDTLMSLKVGETIVIPTRVVRTGSLHVAASRLEKRKEGKFYVTVKGLVDETRVVRLG